MHDISSTVERINTFAEELEEAIICQNVELIAVSWRKYLDYLDRGNSVDSQLLFLTARYGQVLIFQELVNRRADINICNASLEVPLFAAIEFSHKELFKYILNHVDCEYFAISKAGDTVFHYAASNPDTEYLEILFSKFDEHRRAWLNMQNGVGYTPLFLAALSQLENNVRMLVEAGAEVNIPHKERISPLYLLAHSGCHKAVQFLLQKGAIAHIGVKPCDGNIFAMLLKALSASSENTTLVLQQLLIYGAGIAVELPDALFDCNIDWSNVCLIGGQYNNQKVENVLPHHWQQALCTTHQFIQHRQRISDKSLFTYWLKHCEYMVRLMPTNKELTTFYRNLQRLQFSLTDLCINKIVSHPHLLQDCLEQYGRMKSLVEHRLGVMIEEDGTITTLNTSKFDMNLLIQQAILDKDLNIMEDRLQQLYNFKSQIVSLHDQKIKRIVDFSLKLFCWGHITIAFSSFIALGIGAVTIKIISLLGLIFLLYCCSIAILSALIAISSLIFMGDQKKLINHVAEPVIDKILTNILQHRAFSLDATIIESINTLCQLIAMKEIQEDPGLPKSIRNIGGDATVTELLAAIDYLYQFESARKLQIESTNSNDYPKQCQINRYQIFPPPEKKSGQMAIKIETLDEDKALNVNASSTTISTKENDDSTPLLSDDHYACYSESSRRAASAAYM